MGLTLSSVAAPKFVMMTTYGIVSDDKVGTMKAFVFQWYHLQTTMVIYKIKIWIGLLWL